MVAMDNLKIHIRGVGEVVLAQLSTEHPEYTFLHPDDIERSALIQQCGAVIDCS